MRYHPVAMSALVRLETGQTVSGDFRVLRPLAEGGMGAVYVVEQLSTGKQRALKVMHPQFVLDARARERFAQEARVGANLASDHIVEVVAAGVDPATGIPWLAMELLQGDDLASVLQRRGTIPAHEAHEVFAQLCHALGAAHAVGLVHRDLKPENVFLAAPRRAGIPFTVKVLDFGIAKLVQEAQNNSTQAMGSPLWMSPEQTEAGARIRPATDVWALGLVAYRMLTGRPFWRGANEEATSVMGLLREVVIDPLPSATQRAAEFGVHHLVPAGFDAWFARAVCRSQDQRFQNASDAMSALSPVLLGNASAVASAPPAFAATAMQPPGTFTPPTPMHGGPASSAARAMAPTAVPMGQPGGNAQAFVGYTPGGGQAYGGQPQYGAVQSNPGQPVYGAVQSNPGQPVYGAVQSNPGAPRVASTVAWNPASTPGAGVGPWQPSITGPAVDPRLANTGGGRRGVHPAIWVGGGVAVGVLLLLVGFAFSGGGRRARVTTQGTTSTTMSQPMSGAAGPTTALMGAANPATTATSIPAPNAAVPDAATPNTATPNAATANAATPNSATPGTTASDAGSPAQVAATTAPDAGVAASSQAAAARSGHGSHGSRIDRLARLRNALGSQNGATRTPYGGEPFPRYRRSDLDTNCSALGAPPHGYRVDGPTNHAMARASGCRPGLNMFGSPDPDIFCCR